MSMEGLTKIIMGTRYFRKPNVQRRRQSVEAAKALFGEDMARKIRFIERKNRLDAYPGQMTT